MNDSLHRLAQLHGVGESYYDYRGGLHYISERSKAALLAAMGVDVSEQHAIDLAIQTFDTVQWTRMLPQTHVIVTGDPPGKSLLPVSVPLDVGAAQVTWQIALEKGCARNGSARIEALQIGERGKVTSREFVRVQVPLPDDLPIGYHRISVKLDAGLNGETLLIVAPPRCYEPECISRGRRVWGIAVQLYALCAPNNWGMGDFRDLRELIKLSASLGCGIIGLNPLHALLPAAPTQISPYSPSSRQFLNVLYICVPDVPEFAHSAVAKKHVANAKFQALLRELRDTGNVDYARVAAAKFQVLRLLFEQFRSEHLTAQTARGKAFHKFVEQCGEPLRLHAVFDALDAELRLQGPQYWGWPSWPEEYRDPTSIAVSRFARDRADEVNYFLYLQWLANEQLGAAQRQAHDCGMSIGLYGDVAVGANPGGSETWANRHLYLQGASIGAPPDALALKGQDWGIPPQDPLELRAQEYRPFIVLLRNNMLATAALRLDHVMTLFRLWWVPQGMSSAEGAYVHYPLSDLMAILALESERHRCVIIGEDLGTVPDEVREAMESYHAYHYKVLLFEKEADQSFKAPSRYVSNALATVTTHDLPTLRGWWEEGDIGLREQLHLYPDHSCAEAERDARAEERAAMMRALASQGLWYCRPDEPSPPYSIALARAVQCYLGQSNAHIAMIQIEDLIGMRDPANVPGTDQEHANWQRKVQENTADIFARPEVQEMLRAMDKARRGEDPN